MGMPREWVRSHTCGGMRLMLALELVFYPAGVGMNAKKNDAWPQYDDVRFVLVRQPGKARPVRGLILDWRGTTRRQALVAYVSDRTPSTPPMMCQEWLWQEQLTPVDVDPNYRSGRYV